MAAQRLVMRDEAFQRSRADADGYHATARSLSEAGTEPSVVFNVASIAAERYLVALCDRYGAPPPGCTLTELVDAVERLVQLDPELAAQIRAADAYYDICSLDTRLGTPAGADAARMLAICLRLAELADAAAGAGQEPAETAEPVETPVQAETPEPTKARESARTREGTEPRGSGQLPAT